MRVSRLGRFLILPCIIGNLASCRSVTVGMDEPPRPARSLPVTYQCRGGGTLVVESKASAVDVTSPDGIRIDLPASPPGSKSRYGNPPYALLLDNEDALWMKSGKKPLQCKK